MPRTSNVDSDFNRQKGPGVVGHSESPGSARPDLIRLSKVQLAKTTCPLEEKLESGRRRGLTLQMTGPFYPYVPSSAGTPVESVRIGQEQSVDLNLVVHECSRNEVWRTDTGPNRWSAIVRLSAYGPAFDLMVMETSTRYVPDPVSVNAEEGSRVMEVLGFLAEVAESHSPIGVVSIGFNCSPVGFGQPEAQAGLQSIPTKLHFAVFSWPAIPDPGETSSEGGFELKWNATSNC